MPMLSELRRREEAKYRRPVAQIGETESVEVDSRGALSPSEIVDQKLQATLESNRRQENRRRPISAIPR